MGKNKEKANRRKEKKLVRAEKKREKKQKKKEEKLKKLADKKKELEKKKQKVGKGGVATDQHVQQPTLVDFAQSEENVIPSLLEKCVNFIEQEGLKSEGIYRVPGSKSHVALMFSTYERNPGFNIRDLEIPVNAVTTALKDFYSKRLPPVLTDEFMSELLDDIVKLTERTSRLLALQGLLKKLPVGNFEVFKYLIQHIAKIAENCEFNCMDSRNLAICLWPTILPINFTDMDRFEQMRPHLEDIVGIMIDNYEFLFCANEVVMV